MATIAASLAEELVTKAFQTVALTEEDSACIARALVNSNLRGVDTHGVRCVPVYLSRYQHGSLNASAKPTIIRESDTSAVVDGDNALGHIVGTYCMNLAIRKAKQSGVAIVCARNSNHFGATAYYTMMAQAEGLIGAACTNATARIPPTGGKTPSFGNNPWSLAFPCEKDGIPMVVDMANSVVANSHIIIAKAKGEKIPFGWAVDKDGAPTDDPNKASMLLPFGGYKGYGIAMAVEALAGALTGAAMGKEAGYYDSLEKGQNLGHVFVAIDVSRFMPVDEYRSRMTSFIKEVKNSELAVGSTQILVPGEKEYVTFCKRSEEGIPIEDDLLERLKKL